MLKSNSGEVHIQGTKLDLMAEFSHLLQRLITQHVFDDDDIEMCLKVAKMPDDEKKAEIEKAKKTFGEDFMDFMMHLISD